MPTSLGALFKKRGQSLSSHCECTRVHANSWCQHGQKAWVSSTLSIRMNWLEPPGEPPADDQAVTSAAQNSEGPELSTLNYWAHRLTPLHDPAPDYASPETTGSSLMPDQVTFVACNRVGTERGEILIPSWKCEQVMVLITVDARWPLRYNIRRNILCHEHD